MEKETSENKMSLEERISKIIAIHSVTPAAAKEIINEIIKPLTEKAFEAGFQCKANNGAKFNGTYSLDLEDWQKQNLK